MTALRRLHVVGTGLIGTSVALAARDAGIAVTVSDADPAAERVATALLGPPTGEPGRADLAVVAVPPASVAECVAGSIRRNVAAYVTHVASVQTQPQREIEAVLGRSDRVVGGHPIAGREVSGAQHADSHLFRDRPWIVCPSADSGAAAVEAVLELARACGATPVILDSVTHDQVLSRLSHVPQLVASALAATLGAIPAEEVALAGSGIRDTTRLADSDPALWAEIASANASAVAEGLHDVAARLERVAAALAADASSGASAVAELVADGRRGRASLPGKHGRPAAALSTVVVVIPDRPGAMADLLGAVAANNVNLEDLRVEHSPGQPLGVVEIAVAPGERDRLLGALRDAGWSAVAGADAAI